MAVSKTFLRAIKTAGIPAYKIAYKAGIKPGVIYKITAGIDRPKQGDSRVLAIGHELGLNPDELFEEATNE